jgi:hypothetical protein
MLESTLPCYLVTLSDNKEDQLCKYVSQIVTLHTDIQNAPVDNSKLTLFVDRYYTKNLEGKSSSGLFSLLLDGLVCEDLGYGVFSRFLESAS